MQTLLFNMKTHKSYLIEILDLRKIIYNFNLGRITYFSLENADFQLIISNKNENVNEPEGRLLSSEGNDNSYTK